MEFPLMNFEAGIAHSQALSTFLGRLLPLSGLKEFSELSKFYNFWTCSALVIATVAACTSLLHCTVLAFFKIKTEKYSSILERHADFDTDSNDDPASISSDSDVDCPLGTTLNDFPDYADFRVLGSTKIAGNPRKNRSFKRFTGWAAGGGDGNGDGCFSSGIVRLWSDSRGLISMWDASRGEILRTFLGGSAEVPAAVVALSPAVMVAAGVENERTAAMRIWDARVPGEGAAAVAEWRPPRRRRRVVGVGSAGGERVYARDQGESVVLRDMRMVQVPLEEVTELDGQWFDANAVTVGGDGEFGEEEGGESDSVASRCPGELRSSLL